MPIFIIDPPYIAKLCLRETYTPRYICRNSLNFFVPIIFLCALFCQYKLKMQDYINVHVQQFQGHATCQYKIQTTYVFNNIISSGIVIIYLLQTLFKLLVRSVSMWYVGALTGSIDVYLVVIVFVSSFTQILYYNSNFYGRVHKSNLI